jgi:pimeloyl-ACP methyl ester carboxylesterase
MQAAAELFIELSTGPSATASHTGKIRRLMQGARGSVLHDDLLACESFHLSLPHSAFSSPAILISGAEDPIIPLADLRHLVRYIPDSRLHILPGCGHVPLVEQPDQVTALIAGFLAEQFPPE